MKTKSGFKKQEDKTMTYKFKWIGSNTARNITWEYKTDSLRELYDRLQADNIINFYDEVEPIVADYAEEFDIDLDDEDQFNKAYEGAFEYLADEDYKNYIERETGNAYYQWFYRWDDEEGWIEF